MVATQRRGSHEHLRLTMAYRFLLNKPSWTVSYRCFQCTWSKMPQAIIRAASSSSSLEESGIKVEKIDKCVMIRMERGENRLNKGFIQAMNQALDVAESYEDATAVITTGKDKFYSIGLDLEELESLPTDSEKIKHLGDFQKLLGRVLTFPLPTIAAINGHVYAAGAFFAIVQDYRVMRTEKGWYCLPEIFIKRKFSPGLVETLKARLPQPALHKAAILGVRYTAEEAEKVEFVDEVCPVSQLEERALTIADKLAGKEGLDRRTLATLKHGLYQDAYTALNEPIDGVFSSEL